MAAARCKACSLLRPLAALLLGVFLSGCLPRTAPPALPTLLPDPLLLIQQARRQGDPHTALYYVNAQAQASGWTPELHQIAGDVWRDMDATERALPHYAAAAQATQDPNLLRQLASLYLGADAPQAALDTLRLLLAQRPTDRWASAQAGMLLAATDPAQAQPHLLLGIQEDGEVGEIARALLPIVQQHADDPLIGLRVGAALAAARRWQAAEWAFAYVAAAHYPQPVATAYVALLRDFQGKEGAPWMAQALSFAPEDASLWLMNGIHRRILRDDTGSLQALAYALALDPNDPIVHVELGLTYREMGRLREAEYWLQSAVQVSGDDPALRALLLNFYADSAGVLTDTALLSLAGQLQAQPDNPELLSAYGWALHLTGDSFAGLEQIEQALLLDPTNARILFDKARILLELRRVAPALPLLEQVAASETAYAPMAAAMLAGLR